MTTTQPARGANGESMRTALEVDALRAMIRRARAKRAEAADALARCRAAGREFQELNERADDLDLAVSVEMARLGLDGVAGGGA